MKELYNDIVINKLETYYIQFTILCLFVSTGVLLCFNKISELTKILPFVLAVVLMYMLILLLHSKNGEGIQRYF